MDEGAPGDQGGLCACCSMLATNRIPLRPSPALPISADEMGQVKRSIEKVLAPGAKTIYPARDRPFLADALKPEIAGM